jgi:hypothetical protein
LMLIDLNMNPSPHRSARPILAQASPVWKVWNLLEVARRPQDPGKLTNCGTVAFPNFFIGSKLLARAIRSCWNVG